MLVTEEVIPKALWGGKENFEVIRRCGCITLGCQYLPYLIVDTDIREFIELRRYETVSLHHVLQDIKISKCKWLEPACADEKPKKHTNVTDSLKRREIFEEFVFWYFNSFLLPLLSVVFFSSLSLLILRIVVSPHFT